MTTDEFWKQYLPLTKMKATWRDGHNHVKAGLLLDGAVTLSDGRQWVWIDSFTQKVPVEQLLRIESLNKPWGTA
ncbi:hypothetical protein OAA60_00895 [Porticoccaceae bacterium]|nr:hypothetical protein [Porticoccaceae bacterium]